MALVPSAFTESWGIAGMTVSNEQLLYETGSRFVTRIVLERQPRQYGHVAHLPDLDPAHMILSVRDNSEWRRPRGRPRNSWQGKIDRSCRDLLGMDREAAWRLFRKDRIGWRRLVSEAKRPSAYAPH